MGTTTTNYGLYKPASGETGWASLVSANFDEVDSLLFAGDHGNLASDGTLSLHGTAQISLTTSPANWNPTGLSTSTCLFITADAARTVHGIVPGAGDVDGLIKMLWNIGSFDITLADDSGTATAANRLRLPSGDIILSQDQGVMIAYDATVDRWRPIGGVSTSGGGGGGGAPTDAAYLIGSGTAVAGLTGEILVGNLGHFGGELDVVGSTFAAPEVASVHGPEGLPHHDETHPFDDDAIHTNWTAELGAPIGRVAAAGSTGANYGDHVHLGAMLLAMLDALDGPNASTSADQTILSHAIASGLVAKTLLRFTWAGSFTNTSGSNTSMNVKAKIGATTLVTVTQVLPTAQTDAPFNGQIDIHIRSIGASGKAIANGRMIGSSGSGGGSAWSPIARAVQGAEATINTTGSLTFALTTAQDDALSTVAHTIQAASFEFVGVAA